MKIELDDNLRDRFRSTGRKDYDRPTYDNRRPVTVSRPRVEAEHREVVEIPGPVDMPKTSFTPPTKKKQKPKKNKKKLLIIVLIVVVLLVVAGFAFWKFKDSSTQDVVTNNSEAQEQQTEESTQAKNIRFVATGDMIAHTTILEQGKKPDGTFDFSSMMTNMKPYFEKSSVRFCNQATPAGGAQFAYSGYPVFNAPLEWPRDIEGVGCNVMNIGTNHTNDKGQGLIDATVAAWDGKNVLAVVGANRSAEEQAKIRYFEKDGVKFAMLSYTTYTNNAAVTPYGINIYNSRTSVNQIKEARGNADIVLVSMRWGTEYSGDINPEQERIAQEVADAGADVIVGHGPHVLQPTKIVKRANGNNTFVWYSLGNFLNTQIETEALIGGFAIMDINTETKVISSPMFMPTYMHYEWTAQEKAANNLLARKNVSMYVLDQAAEPMSKSQIGTTVEAQTDRVTKVLNTFTPVKIIKSSEF